MVAGDLTVTHIYTGDASSASLRTSIAATTLALATDNIFIVPLGGTDKQVTCFKVEREA